MLLKLLWLWLLVNKGLLHIRLLRWHSLERGCIRLRGGFLRRWMRIDRRFLWFLVVMVCWSGSIFVSDRVIWHIISVDFGL